MTTRSPSCWPVPISSPMRWRGHRCAVAKGGPLLLQPPGALDPRVAAEIDRVLDENGVVHILGGPAALDTSLDVALQAKGYDVFRHAGADRYETAVEIADAVSPTPGSIMLTPAPISPMRSPLARRPPSATVSCCSRPAPRWPRRPRPTAPRTRRRHVRHRRCRPRRPRPMPSVGRRRPVRNPRGSWPPRCSRHRSRSASPAAPASPTRWRAARTSAASGRCCSPTPTRSPPPTQQYLEARKGSLDAVVIYGGAAAVSSAVETAIRAIIE